MSAVSNFYRFPLKATEISFREAKATTTAQSKIMLKDNPDKKTLPVILLPSFSVEIVDWPDRGNQNLPSFFLSDSPLFPESPPKVSMFSIAFLRKKKNILQFLTFR